MERPVAVKVSRHWLLREGCPARYGIILHCFKAASSFRATRMIPQLTAEAMRAAIDTVYRSESRRVLATLIRLLGDFDLAEDALQDAFAAASQQWPRDGVPANPRAWLVSAGRFKAIDAIRRRARFNASLAEIVERLDSEAIDPSAWDEQAVGDDRLRLIFTCCHPALPPEAQVALTLR